MEILIYSIEKNKFFFKDEISEYIKMSRNFATIKEFAMFNNKIAKAQGKSKADALKSYDEIYSPKVDGFCIALDEKGASFDSFEFADILKDKNKVSFFIGGSYGLSADFKSKMDKVISLSQLTFSHKIAKLVLVEQIYRGLSINACHPYHK